MKPEYLNCMNDIEEIPYDNDKLNAEKMNVNLAEIRKKIFPQINSNNIYINKERIGTGRSCAKAVLNIDILKFYPIFAGLEFTMWVCQSPGDVSCMGGPCVLFGVNFGM